VSMRIRPKSEDIDEDELEVEDIKEKRLEMKRLKAERDLLKMKAEVERTKQELAKYAGGSVETSNPNGQTTALSAMIASLVRAGVKAEEANEFLSKMSPEALATLSSLTSNNPYLPVFMYLASQSRNISPQTLTTKDVVDINKTVFDIAKDLSGKLGGSESGMLKEIAGILKDLYNKQLLDKLDEIADRVSSHGSVWDAILEDDTKFRRFKELFGGGATPPEVQIKLEEMRQAHERAMKQFDLELLKLRAQLLESKRKTKMFSEGLRRLGQAIEEGVEEAGKESEKAFTYQRIETPTTLKCPKCNTDIPNITPGAIVECPNCHAKYRVQEKK